jgi:type IV pilus biogenesis protein CpaD/CtpE
MIGIKLIRIDIAVACCAGLMVLLSVSACSLDTPTNLSQSRMQVLPGQFFEEVPLSTVNQRFIDTVIADYSRQGNGPLDLTIAYDPASRALGAAKAQKKASDLKKIFSSRGVQSVHVSSMPVKDLGDDANLIVSYSSYTALPPRDCSMMSGTEDRTLVNDENYRFGCTLDTVVARQVRPKDLAGRGGDDVMNDGRRNANIVERYRTGEPNKALEGESASK